MLTLPLKPTFLLREGMRTSMERHWRIGRGLLSLSAKGTLSGGELVTGGVWSQLSTANKSVTYGGKGFQRDAPTFIRRWNCPGQLCFRFATWAIKLLYLCCLTALNCWNVCEWRVDWLTTWYGRWSCACVEGIAHLIYQLAKRIIRRWRSWFCRSIKQILWNRAPNYVTNGMYVIEMYVYKIYFWY